MSNATVRASVIPFCAPSSITSANGAFRKKSIIARFIPVEALLKTEASIRSPPITSTIPVSPPSSNPNRAAALGSASGNLALCISEAIVICCPPAIPTPIIGLSMNPATAGNEIPREFATLPMNLLANSSSTPKLSLVVWMNLSISLLAKRDSSNASFFSASVDSMCLSLVLGSPGLGIAAISSNSSGKAPAIVFAPFARIPPPCTKLAPNSIVKLETRLAILT